MTVGAELTAKTCPKCSTVSPGSNNFCGNCAAYLATQQATASPTPDLGRKRFPLGYVFFFAAMLLLGVLFYFLINSLQTPATTNSPIAPTTQTTSVTPPTPPPPLGSQWRYSTDQDDMGRKRSFATVDSTNTLNFGFPYSGPQSGRLTIRKKASTEVIFRIEKGQFICGIEECYLNIRFDSGPIRRFSAGEPSDHSSTVLFIENAPLFLSQLRKAKTVSIEATYYQEGSQTLIFDVEGYKPL